MKVDEKAIQKRARVSYVLIAPGLFYLLLMIAGWDDRLGIDAVTRHPVVVTFGFIALFTGAVFAFLSGQTSA